MKSQASASSQPPPSAKPLTAAITGIAQRLHQRRRRGGRARRSARASPASSVGHRLDVGAGDERLVARAGQDRAADAGVAARAPSKRRGQRVERLAVERVERLGRLTVTIDDRALARRSSTQFRAQRRHRSAPTPDRRGCACGVVVEAAPALAPQPAGRDVLAQQRAGPVLAVAELAVQHLEDRQRTCRGRSDPSARTAPSGG